MSVNSGDPKTYDTSTFSTGMTGECLCGSITVTIKKNIFPKGGHMCHCTNCRKFSGCVASNNVVIEKDNVDIDDPKELIKTYNDSNTGSGRTTPRSFCSNCGSPICSIPTDDATQLVLPLGIFPRIPEPEFELFARHKHEWGPNLHGTKLYNFMANSGELES